MEFCNIRGCFRELDMTAWIVRICTFSMAAARPAAGHGGSGPGLGRAGFRAGPQRRLCHGGEDSLPAGASEVHIRAACPPLMFPTWCWNGKHRLLSGPVSNRPGCMRCAKAQASLRTSNHDSHARPRSGLWSAASAAFRRGKSNPEPLHGIHELEGRARDAGEPSLDTPVKMPLA